MKAKSAAIQGALAGVALLAAFATWQRAPEAPGAGNEVVALDLGKSDLLAVRLRTPEATVEVKRDGEVVWVHSAPVPKPHPRRRRTRARRPTPECLPSRHPRPLRRGT